MTDQVQDKSGETDKPQPSQENIQLTIRIMPDLSCQVEGPIHDKILAYGMLAAAGDVIREFHSRQQSKIVKSNGHGIIDFARGFRK